ncbi:MAG: Ribosomal RNA small subunit methyltransferase B [Phycisphaerae bacterium]|nr:Ribosomal RNA small subunit methyltransferase B [Phycisphaerae bacterium]
MPRSQPITDARSLAAEALTRVRPRGPFLADVFDTLAEPTELDTRDRGLAYELAAGVIRHQRTLDLVIEAFSSRAIAKIAPPLALLLRLGAYQLLFTSRIPDHAAVDQTVELGKQWARPRLRKHPDSIGGFINGLLRSLAGSRSHAESARGSDRRRLIETADGYAVLDRDIFAPPKSQPGQWLADAYSFPPWLTARWVKQWGLERALSVARAQNRRPGMTVRINTLRVTPEETVRLLSADNVEAEPVAPGSSLLRIRAGDALASRCLREGLIQPQDATAAAVVEQMALRPGLNVLDRCAAPGTKTTQIVERMNDAGRVWAVDVSPADLDRITTNCKRMGCHIVTSLAADNMPETLLEAEPVSRVLVDAPCSNSGVLARRPEARWRLDSADSLSDLTRLQRELLMDGLNWVAVHGLLVYSTCSLEPEENEGVVKHAIARRQGQVRLVRDKLTLPSLERDFDGGYWAVLERVR